MAAATLLHNFATKKLLTSNNVTSFRELLTYSGDVLRNDLFFGLRELSLLIEVIIIK